MSVVKLQGKAEIHNQLANVNTAFIAPFDFQELFCVDFLRKGGFRAKFSQIITCEVGYSYQRSQRAELSQTERFVA